MFYLFLLDDNCSVEAKDCKTFKDAIKHLAKYYGEDSELFNKAIKGFEDDDIQGLIKLFNHFAYRSICSTYIVEKKLVY